MTIVTESIVEDAALDWFRALDYQVRGGADMAPDPIGVQLQTYKARVAYALRLQRGARGFGRPQRPHRYAHCGPRVVQTLANEAATARELDALGFPPLEGTL